MSSIKDLRIKIEKSPVKKSFKKTKSINVLNLNNSNTYNDNIKPTKITRHYSVNKNKTYSKQQSSNYIKNSLEKKSTTDSSDNLFPKKILRYKSISPSKLYKRLKTQGNIKKSKIVKFKEEIEEIKEINSVKEILIKAGVYGKKQNYQNYDLQYNKTTCSCSCIIF